MAVFAPKAESFTQTFLVFLMVSLSRAGLDAHYYDQTCPQAEKIIFGAVYNASMHDPKVPARILRMFFHDCFIRVHTDAMPLCCWTRLPATKQRKTALRTSIFIQFYVIDNVKSKIEMSCPRIISCADIVAIATRDAVTMTRGPYWSVLKGRKDGKVPKAAETINLPAPTFNVTQLVQSFAKRGLGVKDMVALSGVHSLGFTHCSSFEARLHNFSSVHGTDPSMNNEFAENLRKKCPKPNKDRNAGEFLDLTSSTFDNEYYKRIMAGKGVLGSDQALVGDYKSRWIVEAFTKYQSLFSREFAASMMKLGNVGVIDSGKVRLQCGVVN